MSYLAKERFHLRASSELIVSRMLASFGFALMSSVTALYLREVGLSDSNIGIFTGVASFLAICFSFFVPTILEKINELTLYLTTSLLIAASMFVLGFTSYIPLVVIVYSFSRMMLVLGGNAVSIVFKDVSNSKKDYIKSRGLFGALGNLSWFIAPILGGLLLNEYGTRSVFVGAGVFLLLSIFFILLKPLKIKPKPRAKLDSNVLENLKFYISRPNLVIAYIQNFGVQFWWAFVWVFLPLFMVNEGYSLSNVGIILGLTQLPLFMFEYVTVKAIKPVGYKTIFLLSYLFLAAAMLAIMLTSSFSVVVVAVIAGSLALSFLEPITEIFFFDQVTKIEEEKSFPTFYTSSFLGSLSSKFGVGIAIGLFGANSSYVVMAVVCTAIGLSALKIRKT